MTLPVVPRSRSRRRRRWPPAPPPASERCHRQIPAADPAGGLTFVRCLERRGHRDDHMFPTAGGLVRLPKGR